MSAIVIAPVTTLSVGAAMTEEICDALCKAILEYPSYRTACHSVGLPTSTVSYWIRKANQPGTPPEHVKMIQRIMKAQADAAKDAKDRYDHAVKKGEAATATAILKYMNHRWKDREADDIDHILSGGSFKADDLEKLLTNPSPRLISILQKTGWYSIKSEGLPWLANPPPSVKEALDKNGLSVQPVVVTTAEEVPNPTEE